MTKEIMDVKEIARYLGFSPTKIYRMLTAGEIPNVKVGGQYRFPKAVIDDWLAGKLAVPGEVASRTPKAPARNDGPNARGKRPEDEIVKRLLAFDKTGERAERAKAKAGMASNIDGIDWQYLAGQAEANGVLAEAIKIEKEINRGK